MIIGILNQKGGVGKTTISLNMAHKLAQDSRVMLIDTDVQASASDWVATKISESNFWFMAHPVADLHKKIDQLSNGYDYVIIDGPPRDADIMRSIILASDVILIPVTPSPCDIWASETVLNLIEECNTKGLKQKKIKAAFVLNRLIKGTVIGRDVIAALKHYGLPVFLACITQRVSFAEAAALGLTVYEMEPKGPSVREIDAVVEELKGWVSNRKLEGDIKND